MVGGNRPLVWSRKVFVFGGGGSVVVVWWRWIGGGSDRLKVWSRRMYGGSVTVVAQVRAGSRTDLAQETQRIAQAVRRARNGSCVIRWYRERWE